MNKYIRENSLSHTEIFGVLDPVEFVGRLDNVEDIHDWYLMSILNLTDRSKFSSRMKKSLKFLSESYNTDISLADIAEVLNVSKIYASQLFKKETGVTFIEYLNSYRIKKAGEYLKTGKYKVYEVCELVGFKSVAYFSRIFRKETGVNPGEY